MQNSANHLFQHIKIIFFHRKEEKVAFTGYMQFVTMNPSENPLPESAFRPERCSIRRFNFSSPTFWDSSGQQLWKKNKNSFCLKLKFLKNHFFIVQSFFLDLWFIRPGGKSTHSLPKSKFLNVTWKGSNELICRLNNKAQVLFHQLCKKKVSIASLPFSMDPV